jgi:abortive infection bacteriophage resistance protein
MNKPAYSIIDQILLLKQRGMVFKDERQACERLKNISYYRLKGYWWDMQNDHVLHTFLPGVYFEDIIERYNFDRQLRIILFDAVEQIEIALRTKMIYHLSLAYGGLWYLSPALFDSANITLNDVKRTAHLHVLNELQKEFNRSQEIFVKDHRSRYPNENPDAWKILEVASLGTLSKLYKNLRNKLPEKAIIANEMGLNSTFTFVGWLETIALIRNILAHHSRLWSRTIIKKPSMQLNNPGGKWFTHPLQPGQLSKPFAIISCMVYLCNRLSHSEDIKQRIVALINTYPDIPIYKYGFFNNWQAEPLWNDATKL